MPAYDFWCSACNRKTTEYPLIAERDSVGCGVCGGHLERLFSPPRARPIVPTAYQMAMKLHPEMVEVGDMPQDDFRKEMSRYKADARKESDEAIEKAADEFVGELGDAREGVLAAMQNEDTSTPIEVPEEFVSG